MNPAAIDNLSERIIRVAQLVEKRTMIEVDSYSDIFITSGLNLFNVYVLKGDCLDEYRKVISTALKLPRWAERFSEQFIQKSMQTIVREAVDRNDPTNAGGALRSFLDETDRFDVEHTVYLPIQSLRLEMTDLVIGNITFLPASDDLLKQVLADTQTAPEYFFSRSQISTVAKFIVRAEPERALERAEDAVRDAIEVLVYSLAFVVRPGLLLTPGLQNDGRVDCAVAFAAQPWSPSVKLGSRISL